ncbi:MAG: LptE family protein [Bacteroidota bacterium]
MKTIKPLLCCALFFSTLWICSSCGVYSFTGVNITADNISIQNFYNDADGGPPNLSQTFTDRLRDYYQQNTNLAVVQDDGELQIEGNIVGYTLTPVAPTASQDSEFGDAAALTRLTITVNVSYTNIENDEFDFENRRFSFYTDFDNSQNISAIEADLIEEIFDQITLDIFNATVANW